MTFLRHFERLNVVIKLVNVFPILLRSFWWLNEHSMSSIKRDIARQILRKLMILVSNLWNLPG